MKKKTPPKPTNLKRLPGPSEATLLRKDIQGLRSAMKGFPSFKPALFLVRELHEKICARLLQAIHETEAFKEVKSRCDMFRLERDEALRKVEVLKRVIEEYKTHEQVKTV